MAEIYNSQMAQREDYRNDPRWMKAKACVEKCQFDKANEIVMQIMRDHGVLS